MKTISTLKRTPFKRTFRHWDDKPEPSARSEYIEAITREMKQLGDDTDEELVVDRSREVVIVYTKQGRLAAQAPARGHLPHHRKRGRGKHKTKYARRERAWDYMEWVKGLPCLLTAEGDCWGVVEADHAGDRGVSQKSLDRFCIPLCTGHHKERTDYYGFFKNYNAEKMREWRHEAVAIIHDVAIRSGVEIPDC